MRHEQTMRPGLARLFRLAAAALAAATAVACGGGDSADASVHQATARLDTLVPQWMARTGVPGVAVSVVHDGRTVYARGFGVRRVDEAAPVDADTAFPLASVSKSLAATVMAARMSPMRAGARPSSSFCPASHWPTPTRRTTLA